MEKTAIEIAAEKFLRRGVTSGVPAAELATACDNAIQSAARTSLKTALSLSRKFARYGVVQSGVLEVTGYRALARLSHMSGNHLEALKAYQKAYPLLKDQPLQRARIDRALIDVQMYLGNSRQAKIHARRAITIFGRLKADVDLAQTRVNYGNLLHRQDRHRDAEKLYREAAAVFLKAGNKVAYARALYNQANSLVQLFDMEAAETSYRKAIAIWDEEGYVLDGNDSRYGLAWMCMLKGKFHIALRELTACERVYHEGGDPRGAALCRLDRAEVYLSLGLYADALDSARAVESDFKNLQLRYERSKAALFRGQSAAALGRMAEARSGAKRAETGFILDRNRGFAGAATMLQAQLESGKQRQRLISSARSLFAKAQLPLWQALCDFQAGTDGKRKIDSLARLKSNPAVRAVPQLFAVWQTLEGDDYFRRGDIDAARQAWRRAADRLDAVRAQLPPIELRTAFGRQHESPHMRLIAAELDHEPRAAAVWSERYKTAGIWAPIHGNAISPDRRRVNESLNYLAQQVAALSRHLSSVAGERGLATVTKNRALSRLQKRIREELISVESEQAGTAVDNDDLLRSMRRVSDSMPIVQYHLRDNDIIAFVHQRGEIGVVRIADGRTRLAQAMRRWRFILEGELLAGHLNESVDITLEHRLWAEIGEWLWQPLAVDSQAKQVLLLPEGELANLPWRALRIGNQALLDNHHIVLTPSFRHYQRARRISARSSDVLLVRGAGDDLPQLDREINGLLLKLGDRAKLAGTARRADWPDSGSFDIWHFAGHANLRADNPFYSYLALSDGPLFAADFRLKQCRVNLVSLAACRAGEQVALPGEESTGLVRSLLEMGASNVLAGHWPVADETTAVFMTAFYSSLLTDRNLPAALQTAARFVRERWPSAYHWAAFSVFGAGDMGDIK